MIFIDNISVFFNNLFTNYLILNEMKKINVRKVSVILSDKQMKNVIGAGYGGTGSGSHCYSSTGSCHSACVFVANSIPFSGTCTPCTFNGEPFCFCIQN